MKLEVYMAQGEAVSLPPEHVKREHVLSLLTVVEGTVNRMEECGSLKKADAYTLRLAFKFFRQEL